MKEWSDNAKEMYKLLTKIRGHIDSTCRECESKAIVPEIDALLAKIEGRRLMVTIELECHDCGLYEERNILTTEDPEQSTRSLMRRLNWVETEDGELCPGCAEQVLKAQEEDDRQTRAYFDRQR